MSVLSLLSVGLFVLDGLSADSLRGDWKAICDFVARLPAAVGIPTLMTCTYPFYREIKARGGSGLVKACKTVTELNVPSHADWSKYCTRLWEWGSFSETVMPGYLPETLRILTFGNIRWLMEGYSALLHAFADGEVSPTTVTQRQLATIFARPLAIYEEIMSVLASVERLECPTPEELDIYGDYLPRIAFSNRAGEAIADTFRNRLAVLEAQSTTQVNGKAPKPPPKVKQPRQPTKAVTVSSSP